MYDLAAVKRWLKVTTAADDALLTDLMARALDTVQRELDWYFGTARAATETLDGNGRADLWLRQPPLSGVTVESRSGVGTTWTTVAAADYEVDGRGLFHEDEWTRGSRNYRATYQEGFVVMPGDIEQLCFDLVAAKYKGRKENPGMKSERIGDYAYTRGDLEESTYWAAAVARWRRGLI